VRQEHERALGRHAPPPLVHVQHLRGKCTSGLLKVMRTSSRRQHNKGASRALKA